MDVEEGKYVIKRRGNAGRSNVFRARNKGDGPVEDMKKP